MLSIQNLSYFIGSRTLFNNASFHISDNDKIGLVGLNGSGKTTLLRIISGEIQPDKGNLIKSNDCTIGYLNQDMLSTNSNMPIVEVVMKAFKDIIDLEHKITRISEQISINHNDALYNQLASLQDQYEIYGGYSIHSKAKEILEGIGFKTGELDKPLNQFSGGWRMRVILAQLLLEKPKLLMLDEPTNHLDMPSIQWLEDYLKKYNGSVILVSHDQQFLDNIINMTVEVSSSNLNTYQGNYTFYKTQKELRSGIQKNSFINQQKMIKDTERFIEKFRSKATKARQVQSKIKALNRIELIDEVIEENNSISFHFNVRVKSGRQIIKVNNLTKKFESTILFSNTEASVERDDKIALIGANGQGKSTLLRILAGAEVFEGERTCGHNMIFSFYAQHQLEALHLSNDLITELSEAGSSRTEIELKTLLGCFLFSGDNIYKKIKVLSGGEKARVALAKTIISDANFLLLDEPTNHLDFFSIGILKRALQEYQGTFVLVSHDRQFIEEVCNKIWYIENGAIKEYPGKLSEYFYSQKLKAIPASPQSPRRTKQKSNSRDSSENDHQKDIKKKILSLKKTIKDIDQILNLLHEKKKNIETDLEKSEIYSDSNRLSQILELLDNTEKEIDKHQILWMEAYNNLEKLSSGNF